MLVRHAVGEVLRERRVELGWTLRKLSEKSAVALGYISEVERGHKEASSEILEALAEALGTEVAEVLMDAGARLKVWSLPNIVPTFNETKLLAHSN